MTFKAIETKTSATGIGEEDYFSPIMLSEKKAREEYEKAK